MTISPPGRTLPGRVSGRAAAAAELPAQLAALRPLLASLPLAAKVALLTGADSWRTHACPAIGLRPMVTSDGPAGVRGTTKDERKPSASMPCPAALGATWDVELVHQVALALGVEARSKGVDILLAPTVNLMRTPLGGRGFEFFAEDPVLTARLATAYVRGVQRAGVAATVKHYTANDSETERWTYDARISETVLRELYLVPFEACVREAGAWLIMAAYNSVNGEPMTENARLLWDVLKDEWGFDGVVTSDWHAARSTVPTAVATLDLSMPGPDGPWGDLLASAVDDGQVSEALVDDKLVRLLLLARRVGALSSEGNGASPATAAPADRVSAPAGPAPELTAPDLIAPDLLRTVAAASFVLLRNERQVLPLSTGQSATGISTLAVIGPGALYPTIQGGGSAGVSPVTVGTPAAALTEALAGVADVVTEVGCQTWQSLPEPPLAALTDPVSGQPGVRLEFLAADGELLGTEHRRSANLAWWDGVPAGIGWGDPGRVVLTTSYQAATAGRYQLSAAGVGGLTVTTDGVTVIDGVTTVPADPVEAMTRPGELRAALWLEADTQTRAATRVPPGRRRGGPARGPARPRAGRADDELLAAAEAAAAAADAAVVVVGSAELTESEGFDRETLALPGRQDELVRRVAAVNASTIVVVNCRHAGADAMGRASGRDRLRLAARTGLRRGAGGRAAGRRRARRPAAGHGARRGSGLPGAARCPGLPRRARLRRRAADRVPRVRQARHRRRATRSATGWATPPGRTNRSTVPRRCQRAPTWS